jgi:acetyl-CoA carboxylase biotin carboxyl carrier protein
MSDQHAPRAHVVNADLVASVIAITVEVGDSVSLGQTLLVVDSMKMEIPVTSPANGTVSRIGVAVGDIVQEGDLLVEITS